MKGTRNSYWWSSMSTITFSNDGKNYDLTLPNWGERVSCVNIFLPSIQAFQTSNRQDFCQDVHRQILGMLWPLTLNRLWCQTHASSWRCWWSNTHKGYHHWLLSIGWFEGQGEDPEVGACHAVGKQTRWGSHFWWEERRCKAGRGRGSSGGNLQARDTSRIGLELWSWVVWVVWEALQWHAVANLGEAVNRALRWFADNFDKMAGLVSCVLTHSIQGDDKSSFTDFIKMNATTSSSSDGKKTSTRKTGLLWNL